VTVAKIGNNGILERLRLRLRLRLR